MSERQLAFRIATVTLAAVIVLTATVFLSCYEIEIDCQPHGVCEMWVHW